MKGLTVVFLLTSFTLFAQSSSNTTSKKQSFFYFGTNISTALGSDGESDALLGWQTGVNINLSKGMKVTLGILATGLKAEVLNIE